MNSFEVIGGKKLHGEIIPQGAKNEALQIISAVLLTPEKVKITNIPDILDVNLLIELLGEMNVGDTANTRSYVATAELPIWTIPRYTRRGGYLLVVSRSLT